MNNLQKSGYLDLFLTTLVVVACFHVLLAALGVLIALTVPDAIKLNGNPAQNAGQALSGLVVMLFVILLVDVLAAAVGSGVWMAVRRLFRRRAGA